METINTPVLPYTKQRDGTLVRNDLVKASSVSSGNFDAAANGRDFQAALRTVEIRFADLVDSRTADPKDRRELKDDFEKLLDMMTNLYDDAAGFEPEVNDDSGDEDE